jgi:hypothetical protein
MSEEDVRGGLREAVADEPPLNLDPDALVAAARRSAGRRRALVAAGLATVAVVVAAVAVPAALRGAATNPAAEQPTATSSPAPTSEWPPSGVVVPTYSPDSLQRRAQQMGKHLVTAVPAAIPKAREFRFGQFGGEAEGSFYEGQTSVNAAVSFTIGRARYSIVVTSWVPGEWTSDPELVCAAATDCRRLDDHDGEPVTVHTKHLDQATLVTVSHFRATAGMVSVTAYNYDMASGKPAVYQPTNPVSLDQLTTLATDPELGL